MEESDNISQPDSTEKLKTQIKVLAENFEAKYIEKSQTNESLNRSNSCGEDLTCRGGKNKKNIKKRKGVSNSKTYENSNAVCDAKNIQNSKKTTNAPVQRTHNTRKNQDSKKEKKSYTCKVCSKTFGIRSDLREHTKIHNSSTYECEYCQKQLKSRSGLSNHIRASHISSEKRYSCEICDLKCTTMKSLTIHMKVHDKDEKFLTHASKFLQASVEPLQSDVPKTLLGTAKKLQAVKSKMESDDTVRETETNDENTDSIQGVNAEEVDLCLQYDAEETHLNTTDNYDDCGENSYEMTELLENSEVYSCIHCSEMFTDKTLLSLHMSSHNPDNLKVLNCYQCGKVYSSSLALYRHKLLHNKEGTFSCKICPKTFKCISTLKAHVKRHTPHEEKPFPCKLCPARFLNKRSHDLHFLVHTKEKKFICDKCAKSFRTCQQLMLHNRIHTGEKPHECDVCGKKFRLQTAYKMHYAIHENSRRHMCDKCGKTFIRKEHLKKHKTTHETQGQSPCDQCDLVFRQKHSLKWHKFSKHMTEEERRASSFKVFKCEICNKDYLSQYMLDNHSRTHTGEKPFKCTFNCYKSFADHSNLRAHERIHKGDRKCRCSVCGAAYFFGRDLKKHMLTHTSKGASKLKVKKTKNDEEDFTPPEEIIVILDQQPSLRKCKFNEIQNTIFPESNPPAPVLPSKLTEQPMQPAGGSHGYTAIQNRQNHQQIKPNPVIIEQEPKLIEQNNTHVTHSQKIIEHNNTHVTHSQETYLLHDVMAQETARACAEIDNPQLLEQTSYDHSVMSQTSTVTHPDMAGYQTSHMQQRLMLEGQLQLAADGTSLMTGLESGTKQVQGAEGRTVSKSAHQLQLQSVVRNAGMQHRIYNIESYGQHSNHVIMVEPPDWSAQ